MRVSLGLRYVRNGERRRILDASLLLDIEDRRRRGLPADNTFSRRPAVTYKITHESPGVTNRTSVVSLNDTFPFKSVRIGSCVGGEIRRQPILEIVNTIAVVVGKRSVRG